jgi:hypothetical protein
MDSGHISRPTSRIKGKQRIKEYSYVEPACSNIVVHRIVDNQTTNMVRARTKCEIDGEIPRLGLLGHRDFTNSYMNT